MRRSSNYEICFSLSASFLPHPGNRGACSRGSSGRATTGRAPHLPQLTASLCNTPGEPSLVMTWIFMKFRLSRDSSAKRRLNAIQWIHRKKLLSQSQTTTTRKKVKCYRSMQKISPFDKQYRHTPSDEIRLKNRSKRSEGRHNDAVESTPSASESIASAKKADWWFRKILNEIGQ